MKPHGSALPSHADLCVFARARSPQVGQHRAPLPSQSKRIPQLCYEEARFQRPTRLSTGERHIQFLIGGLVRGCSAFSCPHLAQTDNTALNRLPKMGFGEALTQRSAVFTSCANYLGVGTGHKHRMSAVPEGPGTPAARPRTLANLGQEAEGLTRLVCLVRVSGRKE